MYAIHTYIFYQSLNRLQRGLSAIAELLVFISFTSNKRDWFVLLECFRVTYTTSFGNGRVLTTKLLPRNLNVSIRGHEMLRSRTERWKTIRPFRQTPIDVCILSPTLYTQNIPEMFVSLMRLQSAYAYTISYFSALSSSEIKWSKTRLLWWQ